METYAHVVSFVAVRIFLFTALCFNMHMVQVDVKTAFRNGIFNEDIWVISPRGVHGRPVQRYKRKKEFYGLKQAHLSWHKKL